MSPADRARIAELLQDESLSFREIARRCGYSDHTVRRIWREITHDPRPIRNTRSNQQRERAEPFFAQPLDSEELPPAAGWVIYGAGAILLTLMVWAYLRQTPPESWD